MAIAMNAYQRMCTTKSELRILRNNGQVPGVVYGKQLMKPTPITVGEKELHGLIRSNPNAVLEMDVPGQGKHSVMIAEVQRDTMSRHITHVDFRQVNMDEKIRTNVRIEAMGDSVGVSEGGILSIILHELDIQCLPGSIPEAIEIDVTNLGVGESMLVGDIKLPEGVEAKFESDSVVLTILAPQKALSEDEAEEASAELQEAEERSNEAKLQELKTH